MWGESGTSERERMCGVKVCGMRVGIESASDERGASERVRRVRVG